MGPDDNKMLEILDLARHSPSVHNTQPWRFGFDGAKVAIQLESQRRLKAGDPVGRQTWISLGCLIETILTAAKSHSLAGNPIINEGGAHIAFSRSSAPTAIDLKLAKAILNRFTDRSRYRVKPLPQRSIDLVTSIDPDEDTSIVLIDDKEKIKKVAALTSKGIRLALSHPDFRSELARFITRPFSSRADGIPTKSLRLNPLAGIFEPLMVKTGLNTAFTAKHDYSIWASSPAIALVLSKGDNEDHWVRAGRTYMRLALHTTALGLRSATSAAVVEAADFHEDVEHMVGSKQRLQAVMRIGYSNSKEVHSPRLPLDQLLLHRTD